MKTKKTITTILLIKPTKNIPTIIINQHTKNIPPPIKNFQQNITSKNKTKTQLNKN